MLDPTGGSKGEALRLDFDRRLMLRCRGRCSRRSCCSSPGCGHRPHRHDGRRLRCERTMREVRLNAGKAARFHASRGRLAGSIACDLHEARFIRCRRRPKARACLKITRNRGNVGSFTLAANLNRRNLATRSVLKTKYHSSAGPAASPRGLRRGLSRNDARWL